MLMPQVKQNASNFSLRLIFLENRNFWHFELQIFVNIFLESEFKNVLVEPDVIDVLEFKTMITIYQLVVSFCFSYL